MASLKDTMTTLENREYVVAEANTVGNGPSLATEHTFSEGSVWFVLTEETTDSEE